MARSQGALKAGLSALLIPFLLIPFFMASSLGLVSADESTDKVWDLKIKVEDVKYLGVLPGPLLHHEASITILETLTPGPKAGARGLLVLTNPLELGELEEAKPRLVKIGEIARISVNLVDKDPSKTPIYMYSSKSKTPHQVIKPGTKDMPGPRSHRKASVAANYDPKQRQDGSITLTLVLAFVSFALMALVVYRGRHSQPLQGFLPFRNGFTPAPNEEPETTAPSSPPPTNE